jgi:hypothetical protein
VLEETFVLPPEIKGAATVLNLTCDGWIIFVTDEAWIGAVKQDFSIVRREVFMAVTGGSCTGTGTTPTLVGRAGMDELVVVVDSHRNNNLVAFWRNELPTNRSSLPGQDARVAGYDIAVAQYVGFFKAGCDVPRGVQMARWNPDADKLDLLWANGDVPFHNIVSISFGSSLLYGSGKDMVRIRPVGR